MRLELLKESKHIPRPYFYDRHNTIIHIGNYGNHPIYISKTVPNFWVGMCGPCGEIFINNEVYELLQESSEFERLLETICEHEVRYGYYNHEHGPITNGESEVLGFLRKQGVDV